MVRVALCSGEFATLPTFRHVARNDVRGSIPLHNAAPHS